MKNLVLIYFASLLCLANLGCTQAISDKESSYEKQMEKTMITEEKALEVAQQDAQNAYQDLSIYKVERRIEDGNWIVEYHLKDPNALGGGPHYVISGETGEIISFRYYQ